MVVSRTGRIKVKKLYHEVCFESLYSEGREAPSVTDARPLRLIPGYRRQLPAPHIRLVKGVWSENPGEVLCPVLAGGSNCRKHKDYIYFRPKLLVRNHADPALQLWMCRGCMDFLLRVKID